MATFKPSKKPKPIEITEFYGINEAVGETEVKVGEWIAGYNAMVTKDYKIKKRHGHHKFIDFTTGAVQGLWYGEIASKLIMLVCHGGYVYEYDMTVSTETIAIADLITEGTVTQLGTITNAKTQIFWFKDKLYFINGTDYKEYDGTTYQDVVPYVPTILIGASPTGSGTLFEEINLLGGSKIAQFDGNGSDATYTLPEQALDSVDEVYVNDVLKTVTTDYTVNLTNGTVTFVSTPTASDEVKIQWTKANATNVALVKNHKYATLFGYSNDTNIFLFGNENEQGTFRYSKIGQANYYPADSYTLVGSTQFAITSMLPQYQTLLVFKEGATFVVEPSSNPNYADNTGLNPYEYGYQSLNSKIGNQCPNGVQLINDTPVAFDGYSFRLFTSSRSVRNEVEPSVISDRLKISLQSVSFADCVSFDNEYEKELWLTSNGIAYIWNYGNDTMYKHDNIYANQFIDVEGDMYFGTPDGLVNDFSTLYEADSEVLGDNITMKLYSGFHDFGQVEFLKNMTREWLSIKPETRTSVRVKFVTDRTNEEAADWVDAIEYKLFDFNDIDFNDFSFLTNRSAQSKRLNKKVKKFVYLQWIFENDTNDETLVILKLLLGAEIRGYSK